MFECKECKKNPENATLARTKVTRMLSLTVNQWQLLRTIVDTDFHENLEDLSPLSCACDAPIQNDLRELVEELTEAYEATRSQAQKETREWQAVNKR